MQDMTQQDPSQLIPEPDVPALVLEHVRLSYLDAERRLDVLRDIAIEVMPGETVALIALTLSLLATLYPAWRAANLDPVDALRYE